MKVVLISGKARSGKDTFASIFKELANQNDKKVLIIRYADILKFLCREYLDWDGVKDEKGRTLLQYIGTDVVRKNNPDTWVNCVKELVKGLKTEYDYVLIPDTRFPNEIECWMGEEFDYSTVRIERVDSYYHPYDNQLSKEQKEHKSEVALDNYLFDYVVQNVDKDMDGFICVAQDIYESIEEM